MHVLRARPLEAAPRRARRVELDLPLRCSRPSAPARPAAAASPSSTRACSPSTRSTAGAPTCYGTGLKIAGVEWARSARPARRTTCSNAWIEWREIDEACPDCEGKRLNPEALARALPRPVDRRPDARSRSAKVAGIFRELAARGPRGRDRARHRGRARRRASASSTRSGSRLPRARPLGADALRRRGAAHPARRAARLQPARRVLHPRRADHRPAPARQPRSCSTRWRSSRRRATRWSWSSTTRTRSAAPQHVIDLGPGAGKPRRRTSSREGDAEELMRNPDSVTGRFLRSRSGIRCSRGARSNGATPSVEVARREPAQPQGASTCASRSAA